MQLLQKYIMGLFIIFSCQLHKVINWDVSGQYSMSLPSYSVKGRGGVRVGGLEPLTSRTMLFSVTYLCLSLTGILLVFCFSFLFVFLMNKLLLSYLLYPFAQLARAENTIIFFRLPFGWFFIKTLFLQFVCLFVLHKLYVCSVCKIMRS